MKKLGPFKSAIFNTAYHYKLKWYNRGYDTPLLDKYIFATVKQILGGQLRLILSGGAPLSPETHTQVKLCLCVTVTQGYGLTETCSCATVMDSMYFYILPCDAFLKKNIYIYISLLFLLFI